MTSSGVGPILDTMEINTDPEKNTYSTEMPGWGFIDMQLNEFDKLSKIQTYHAQRTAGIVHTRCMQWHEQRKRIGTMGPGDKR